MFVDDKGTDFAITADAGHLNDATISMLSHDVGVGVADLVMEDLGFVWRSLGSESLPAKKKRPDLVYDVPWSLGNLVVMEAKGGVGRTATLAYVDGRTYDGYVDQVEPWLGDHANSGHPICHGYAIGTCSPSGGSPGKIIVHEASVPAAGGSPPAGAGGGVPTPAALALTFTGRVNYAAAFSLMGAEGAGRYIRTGDGRVEEFYEEFIEQSYLRRRFLVSETPRNWLSFGERVYAFALDLGVAQALLNGRREAWEQIPLVPDNSIRGFLEDPMAALFRDGLALIPLQHGDTHRYRFWPGKGLGSPEPISGAFRLGWNGVNWYGK